jgi:hypothetical protein
VADVRRRRHPLGLPPGSVRALLALMIVSTAIVQTVRSAHLNVALAEALMIVLASYFTTRRVIDLPPDVLEKLEQEGQVPSERHPLYLPRFSIRVIIVVSFLGLAAYLYQRGELFTENALATLGLVFAYFVGVLVRGLGKLFGRWKLPEGVLDWFADLRAIVVLGATATLTVCYWAEQTEVLPPWAESTTLSLLLFYFGAR